MDTFSPNVKVENHLYFMCHADVDILFSKLELPLPSFPLNGRNTQGVRQSINRQLMFDSNNEHKECDQCTCCVYNRIMLPKKELQKIDFMISQIGSHEMYEREERFYSDIKC